MKNYEKYADEIKGYNGSNFCGDFVTPYIQKSNKCNLDDCGMCNMLQMIWLMEDYEEPEVDWSKVEVDTPILVRQTKDGEWLRRHFAKYEDGIVYTWKDCKTSWTAEGHTTAWKCAKLADEKGGEQE